MTQHILWSQTMVAEEQQGCTWSWWMFWIVYLQIIEHGLRIRFFPGFPPLLLILLECNCICSRFFCYGCTFLCQKQLRCLVCGNLDSDPVRWQWWVESLGFGKMKRQCNHTIASLDAGQMKKVTQFTSSTPGNQQVILLSGKVANRRNNDEHKEWTTRFKKRFVW